MASLLAWHDGCMQPQPSAHIEASSLRESALTLRCQSLALLQVDRLITGGRSDLTLVDLQASFRFPLDSFQSNAVQALLDGESVVCCAPTGAGKTAIAEAAAVAVLARWALQNQGRLLAEAATVCTACLGEICCTCAA